jgi:hypothetical protein
LNIITGSNGGRPPCEFHRSLECLELVTEIAQPLQTSKNPACLRIESSPIHPSQWKQKCGELARFIHMAKRSSVYINRPPVTALSFVAAIDDHHRAMFLSPRFAGEIRERLVSDAQLFEQMVVGDGAKAARADNRNCAFASGRRSNSPSSK